ncbi:MAG: tetratricopeptide repeat protein [Actinobacteria bacterium]|nr:tetratricopeptide repeat protein [Actinomycetota bacterium]
MSTTVNAVTEHSFATDVLDASVHQPVVVDFWAPWCGPCRQLSPLLEQTAQRFADDVTVVKCNVDEAPRLAQQFQVQGIPAVKAFRDRRVVSEFVGLQPATAIEQFFAGLAPSAADRLVARATEEPARAESLLTQALEHEPSNAGALISLARLARGAGRYDDARALLERASQHEEAQRLLAELRLESAGNGQSLDALAARADDSPQARLAYGRALLAAERHEKAVDVLLAAVTDAEIRDDARTLLLDLFRVLGDGHEITRRARPRLASALFA